MRRTIATSTASLLLSLTTSAVVDAFVVAHHHQPLAFVVVGTTQSSSTTTSLWNSAPSTAAASETTTETVSFIDTELRGAAMKLHTRKQAPAEGEVAGPEQKPYAPTHADYLAFLVDSKFVYETMEQIVNTSDNLQQFRNTGLERVNGLERDIEYMTDKYDLEIPEVGSFGTDYAAKLKSIIQSDNNVPEFMCHYYNWYFAHTAGGRMIGKQMSALLLNKHTLDFYKWDGDLNEIKGKVKRSIEDMAAAWTPEERQECIDGTADAFRYGGAINSYLMSNVRGN